MKAKDIIKVKQLPWNGQPNIGWWLDHDPVTFYHGTHVKNLDLILDKGLKAPSEGSTAGMISLAIEPNTAWGYASMTGGETNFRAAGADAVHVPKEDRVVFVFQIPQKFFLSIMAPARSLVGEMKDRLTDKQQYERWCENHKDKKGKYHPGFDQQYYGLTEIRIPDKVSNKFIVGFMKKGV